jgi:hypothetical protein
MELRSKVDKRTPLLNGVSRAIRTDAKRSKLERASVLMNCQAFKPGQNWREELTGLNIGKSCIGFRRLDQLPLGTIKRSWRRQYR